MTAIKEKNIVVCENCGARDNQGVAISIGTSDITSNIKMCSKCANDLINCILHSLNTIIESIPDYGTVFTIEDFYKGTLDEAFIEDDGHGYYAKLEKNEMYRESVRCIHDPDDVRIEEIKAKAKGFTHIVWFNK